MADVVVIGAGMAGLVCAQRLHQQGYRVVVVEKSRGLGGRVATRRLPNGCADHGVRYLDAQGALSDYLIQVLTRQGVLHQWTDTIHTLDRTELDRPGQIHGSTAPHPRYTAQPGITAVAKHLAMGLEVWCNQRVHTIQPTPDRTWEISLEPNGVDSVRPLTAKAIVIAIPAPQALMLLEPLTRTGLPGDRVPDEMITALQSVQFDPCITAIAVYPPKHLSDALNLPWKAITCPDDPDLDWVAIDSSKRSPLDHSTLNHPIVILQSTATFAQTHLESTDLQSVGHYLIDRAAQSLVSWLGAPELVQVHRWRYAFVSRPLSNSYLTASYPLPVVCAGDWCGGGSIESALRSGVASAAQTMAYLEEKPVAPLTLADTTLETQFFETIDRISGNL